MAMLLPFRRCREEPVAEGGWCPVVFDHALPSRVPGVPFEVRFQGKWRRADRHGVWERRLVEAAVREELRSVAVQVSRECEPGDRSSVADRLVLACAGPLTVSAFPGIEAGAEVLVREDLRHDAVLGELDGQKRAEYLRNWRLDARMSALATVLSRRATAYAWWLRHCPDKIEYLEDGKIKEVSDVIAAEPGRFGDGSADLLSRVTTQFVSRLSVNEQRALLGGLPDLLLAYGQADLADELRTGAP
ncbi:hypothetical protein NLX83_22710 [Allokutzneria sp. A3M-2-11 16]|uniref:hypothetical protein n=1 Tax=Allokutzneria sp. A3M-2-11 16 TaxID=2962043 RepID=UPI0020B6ABB0|nr:hypothetical protein [Allokutzneria sp. A3M-2-11 16]MCP3802081.1 hypothetical protein [Allokutzneria sp. A3M-2-11 16]